MSGRLPGESTDPELWAPRISRVSSAEMCFERTILMTTPANPSRSASQNIGRCPSMLGNMGEYLRASTADVLLISTAQSLELSVTSVFDYPQ